MRILYNLRSLFNFCMGNISVNVENDNRGLGELFVGEWIEGFQVAAGQVEFDQTVAEFD